MTIKSGTHAIGPDTGTLTVFTYVGGMGAKMGHDLTLEVGTWSGTVTVDADNLAASSVQMTADLRTLEIVEASGGVKPLSDKDRAEIAKNIEKTLQTGKFPEITFQSTAVAGAAPSATVEGEATLAGSTKPVTIAVAAEEDGVLTATTAIVQTEFGIKPYSKMGALKVKDQVDMAVKVTLPAD